MMEPMDIDREHDAVNGIKRKADDAMSILEAPKKNSQKPFGGEVLDSRWNTEEDSASPKPFTCKSSSLPFGQPIAYSSITGPTYITAQVLIQQVAYGLSDKIFSYSPESFDLDVAVKNWFRSKVLNVHGYPTHVSPMQTRTGAGSIALGYMFSKDFDLAKRHIPQSLLASSSSLLQLRSSLDQLSLLYSVANPFVAHVAAVDYAPGSSSGLVTDYASALAIAEELGLGLVSSSSAFETQHMALFATLLATVLPTLHIYDGINVGRNTVRIVDALSQSNLGEAYKTISEIFTSFSKRSSSESKVAKLLEAFNRELGTSYGLFEYSGHEEPDSILVVFGTVEASLASQVANKLAKDGAKVGVINVRVYRPFVEEAFLMAIPSSVRSIAVLGQVVDENNVKDPSIHSSLYEDVLAATVFSEKWATAPSVIDIKYSRDQTFTPSSMAAIFPHKTSDEDESLQLLVAGEVEQYTFWDVEDSSASTAPASISKLLSSDSATNVLLNQTHDNLVQGGTVRTDIRSSKRSMEAPYPIEAADVTVVAEENLFKEIGILRNVKAGGKLIVKLPGAKDEDLEKRLPLAVRNEIKFKNVELFVLDPALSDTVQKDSTAETYITELAFLRVARPELLHSAFDKLAALGNGARMIESLSDVENALRQVAIPDSWSEVEVDTEIVELPRTINFNSFTGFEKEDVEPPALLRDWQSVAKSLVFKEAYGAQTALRPDLTAKTFEVTVQENRRLTPVTYDRNIFHIEFDLGTSGLKYDIGEALGVHAENDVKQVEEFMGFYGLNPDDVVEVPSREDASLLETRTVFQSLVQNIDIFGKPPKRFYESLADFASDEKEKKELLTLGGPEGANEFKRRAEVDTVTYADILLEFKSAHPDFHDIARIVAPMKRREYSIASSQMVNPSTVALMIVVVSWVDPQGRDRFGQATRYLSQLPVGSKVTVSVKPSVMKLPTKDTAPLIMAGLGTGLAPFRAFVQYRAMQKAQGKEIGSILLYMGSRHQREEYLYGEEWEAYQDAGVITLLGRAFSRDQPQKIYIQDRMRESINDIIKAYIKEEGAFYLCGPTWPVPDVTEVLEEAIARNAKAEGKKVDSKKEIERLKEELRYVLEVY
ncbi:hypothetical protein BP5796_04096 [Coleophoma crateriformis]|uniref:assimilatory sulfite reductase (NADPH) n=1 Tax=Coleophoma crateriformis TaxID=565419 RepID=A0A3D8SHX5_9HELO|nr:hypothetical protein BP5796_04096 [Coleophoma crateriformis]